MEKELIEKLILQHSRLRNILVDIREMSKNEHPSHVSIDNKLKEFSKLLVEHIYLENNFVYRNIYENPKMDLASALSARSFFEDMKLVRNGILAFLKSYNEKDKILKDFENFNIQLEIIAKIFNTRVKLEEEGLFKLYKS